MNQKRVYLPENLWFMFYRFMNSLPQYPQQKKFANFNEFFEIKKFVQKFVKCPSGRGLPVE